MLWEPGQNAWGAVDGACCGSLHRMPDPVNPGSHGRLDGLLEVGVGGRPCELWEPGQNAKGPYRSCELWEPGGD